MSTSPLFPQRKVEGGGYHRFKGAIARQKGEQSRFAYFNINRDNSPGSHAAGLGDNAVRHIAWTNPRWPIGVGRTGAGRLIAETDCASRLRREVGDQLRQTLRHRSRSRTIRRRRDQMRIDKVR